MADANRTKRVLADALKKLMEEMPFSKISVADICGRCDMNRKTFYYHFKDKYDLVNWIFDVEFLDVIRQSDPDDGIVLFRQLAEYFYANRAFYRKALEITGQNSFADHFHEMLDSVIRYRIRAVSGEETQSDFQINVFADGLLCAVQRWLLDKNTMPPDTFVAEMEQCLRYISLHYPETDQDTKTAADLPQKK